MTTATAAGPVLLDLAPATWDRHLDRAAAWLNNCVQVQEKFRKYAADTAGRIREPHIREYLQQIAGRAERHEEDARGILRAVGREPGRLRSAVGVAAAKAGEVLAGAVGLLGSTRGDWNDLRQLLLESQDALGAFAVAEQLGYALANPELADTAFRVVAEKWTGHLLIQEYVLEMGAQFILYHEGV